MSSRSLERVGMTIRFDGSGEAGGTWDVRLGLERDAAPRAGNELPAYGLRVEARWLDPMLTGRTRWEDRMLSLLWGTRCGELAACRQPARPEPNVVVRLVLLADPDSVDPDLR
jgi:hypothetical protein